MAFFLLLGFSKLNRRRSGRELSKLSNILSTYWLGYDYIHESTSNTRTDAAGAGGNGGKGETVAERIGRPFSMFSVSNLNFNLIMNFNSVSVIQFCWNSRPHSPSSRRRILINFQRCSFDRPPPSTAQSFVR